jgi:hypothetical protein
MMIDMDSLLVKCPHCGAWPMAANVPRTGAQQVIKFTCTKCLHQEGGRLRRTTAARPIHEPAPAGVNR